MSTFNEENPITYRIAQMQVKWAKEVTAKTQLIRWLVKKDEVRMIKAFNLLEGSEHGKLPELFLNFQQPFESIETYGKDLTDSWISLWNDQNSRNEIAHANVLPEWDDSEYHDIKEKKSEWTFMKCMSSFASAIDPKTVLILNIMPHAYTGNPEFAEWINKCLKSLPSNLKIAIVDLEENPKFKNIPTYINQTVLVPNLNMPKAVKEIVSSGDTNNPAVGVNMCLLNIAEAINNNNEKQIHHWGKEGIKIAQETNLKSIEATVLLAYGSALYQLKKFDKALDLYKKAEDTSVEGLNTQDPTVPTLLLQSYNMQAATYLYKKKYTKAEEYYIKTATEARSQNNIMMEIEAYRQAAYVVVKNYEKEKAYTFLQEAYKQGKKLEPQTQKFSSMLLVSIELHKYADENRNDSLKNDIAKNAVDIWGEHWQNTSQKEVYKQILTT